MTLPTTATARQRLARNVARSLRKLHDCLHAIATGSAVDSTRAIAALRRGLVAEVAEGLADVLLEPKVKPPSCKDASPSPPARVPRILCNESRIGRQACGGGWRKMKVSNDAEKAS